MCIKKMISVMLVIVFAVPAGAAAEETIKKDELLTLQRCVEIALMNHPTILAARNNVSANESRVGQARSNYYPQIDASANAARKLPQVEI